MWFGDSESFISCRVYFENAFIRMILSKISNPVNQSKQWLDLVEELDWILQPMAEVISGRRICVFVLKTGHHFLSANTTHPDTHTDTYTHTHYIYKDLPYLRPAISISISMLQWISDHEMHLISLNFQAFWTTQKLSMNFGVSVIYLFICAFITCLLPT